MSASLVQNLDFMTAFRLCQMERIELRKFWNDLLTEYEAKYTMKKAIGDFQNYVSSLKSDVEWPQPMGLNIQGETMDLYLFKHDSDSAGKDMATDDITVDEINESQEPPTEPEIDMNRVCDINEPSPKSITIMDYKYWLVYFANATVCTLIPAFWSDGFDIPPFMVPLILPAIYIPVAPPIYIKPIGVLLVCGIAMRGIWPAPIIITLNMTSQDINAMLPVMIAMNVTKMKFQKALEKLENGIPKLVTK